MNTKRIITITALMFIGISVFSQKGVINSGAKIVITSNAVLRISGGSDADYTNQSNGSDHGRIDLDGKIIMEGDWINNATAGNVLINTDTDGEVKFAGAAAQTIGGTRASYFENLTLNNSGGLTLFNDISLKGNLYLDNGNIFLLTFNLMLGTSSAIIGTPSETKMIVTTGGGELRKMFADIGSFTFPVGDSAEVLEYSPATLNFTSGTFGGSAYAGINVSDFKHPDNSSSTDFLSRYWTVEQNNISSFSCDVTFEYLDSDINGTESNIYGGQWESPNWIKLNPVNTSSNLVTGTVSSFSDFTGGESSGFSITMTMTDDGSILEAAEDGEIIYVVIQNDIFADPLTPSNWTVTNLPSGVTKGAINRINDTQATITLSGNRNIDYDSNITDVTVEIDPAELELSTSSLVSSTGIILTATPDPEEISISDDGITEGSENGEEIIVILTGGTFVSSLTDANWTLTNLPDGVTKGSVVRDNATQATITLGGNRTTDYDSDITNLTVTVTDDEIDDHTGADIFVNTGVTFTAVVESAEIDTTTTALSESNLNGSIIQFGLENETFADATLDKVNFSLNNAPPETSVNAVSYVDPDSATITLAFDGTDFDMDYNFSVTVSANELSGVGPVTSNTLLVTALIEAATASIWHAGLTEENLNSADIDFTLSNEEFIEDSYLDPANFSLGHAPGGTSVSAATYNTKTNATITLSYDGTDFDNDISNFYIIVAGSEVKLGSSVASSTLPITATDDIEGISMADDGNIIEGEEDGEVITVTLSGGTYVDPLTTGNWTLTNLPDGVTKGAVVRTDATHTTITLNGNRTTDYDSDITNLTLSVSTDEINDTSGADITTSTGVTFKANNETAAISHDGPGLDENNLNGAVVGVKLSNETFADGTLDKTNFYLNNYPDGTSVNAVSYEGPDTATVTLIFDGTDFDADYEHFSITIDASELSGVADITSNELVITAIDEPGVVIILHAGLTEANLDGADISLALDQETFADNSLISTNFTLNNKPSGVTVSSVTWLSSTSATVTLEFDGTDFDSNVTNFNITVAGAELTKMLDITSNDLTITANNDDESLSMSDDGEILEGGENNEVITVTLTGGTFIDPLNDGNWSITGLPDGVSVGTLVRNTDTEATITLNGVRTTDYDADITNATLYVNAAEVNDYSGADLSATGITFTAVVESATISHAGLTEENLNGAEIGLKLINESFNDPSLSVVNFNLNNAPIGTAVNAAIYHGADTATVTLAFDGTDFDADSTNFNITIDASELIGAGDVTSDSLTIEAVDEPETATISHAGLNETNLDGADIDLTLSDVTFADATLDKDNFILNNAPAGTTVNTVTYNSSINATVTLEFDGTDFDTDITNFSITVALAELSNGSSVTSNNLTIAAVIEPESISITDPGLTEENLNGSVITLTLSNVEFIDGTLDKANFILNNSPIGTTVDIVSYIDSITANLTISFNGTDFDDNVSDFSITVSSGEITGSTDLTSNGIGITATVEAGTLTISHVTGLTESNLDGAVVNLVLNEVLFEDISLDSSNFILNNAPTGTSVNSVTYVSETEANLTLAFDGMDFDADINNFSITISSIETTGEIDITSNNLIITAVVESETATISHVTGLTEENLDNAIITLVLINIEFDDGTLDPANFILNNAPEGTTVSKVTYTSATEASITLVFDGTDFDENISNFYIVVGASEVTGGYSIASSTLPISATDDAESISMTDDGEITEGNEDGEVITVILTGGTFIDPLTTGNWTLTNLPDGVTKGAIVRTDATHTTITLSGNRTTDYDSDITNLTLSISSDEINDTTGSDITTNTGVTFTAIDEPGVLTISHAGLTEVNLYGAVINIALSEIQFVDATLDPANFTLNNAPAGTSVGSVSYTSSVIATVTLSYDGSDFDTDITSFSVTINAAELSGGVSLTSNTLTITATVELESVTISHDGLNGDNLNGAEIAIELANVNFADTILDKANFTLNNTPSGTSIDTVTCVNVTHANLTLAYDGTVFNDTILDFNITVSSSELTGLDDLTSNDLIISPVTGISPYPETFKINIYSYEDRIFIKCSDPEKLKEVAVYNILGRELIRRKLDKSPLNEISAIVPSSYYVVRIYTNDGIYMRKVFIAGR